MTTSHSLPSPSQRTAGNLPFSSGPPATSIQRAPVVSPPKSSVPPNRLPHIRTGSVVSSRSRAQHNTQQSPIHIPELPFSSTIPLTQPRPIPSTTHAGGILPPASFFHPSRPSYSPPSPTPRTPTEIANVSTEAGGHDAIHLTSMGQRPSGSEDSGSLDHSIEDHKEPTLAPSVRSPPMKHSREPLLPIGEHPARKSSNATRPTVVTQGGPYSRTSEANSSTGGRMRDSFEKLWKKGFNLDGRRRSFASDASPVSPSTGTRMTFELNVTRSNRSPITPASKMRQKRSLSPPQGSSVSLDNFEFIPTPPPNMDPPLAAVPERDPQTGKIVKNWRLHPSRNRFFLGGRILAGGDSPWAFIASLTVVLVITGVWFGTTCVWWWVHESPTVAAIGAYMCLLTISSMFATAFRDPGILPRNLDPDPPYPLEASTDSGYRVPLPRDLKVRAGIVRTKYCPTCRIYRPPRSSHCKMCDNCVDGCDHHCQWVNNCVGRRNYTSFFTFLTSAVLTLILVICTSAIHLYLLTRKFHMTFHQAISTSQGIGSAIAFSISIVIVWPVTALLSYHLRLLLLNVTTIEQIRNQAHKTLMPGPAPPNPFSHGSWLRNMVYVLCRPAGYSWLNPTGVATSDKREINPGLLHDSWLGEMEEARGRGKGG